MSLNWEVSSAPAAEEDGEEKNSRKPFKGVRRRKWGRWVSEIRVPRSRSRIWLGSYDTADKAARAYDAALYCLRGAAVAGFNFPMDDEVTADLSEARRRALTKAEVKAIAARHAFSASLGGARLSTEKEAETEASGSTTSDVGARAWEVVSFAADCSQWADATEMGDVFSLWDLV